MCISTPRSNLVVRFLSVFLLCCTSLYASTDQTGKQKVTVVGNDVTLGEVFKQIEKQTGLRFMYAVDAVDVKERVTVMFEKVMLDEVLGTLLRKKGVEWAYREGAISLRPMGVNLNPETVPGGVLSPPLTISGKVLDAKGNPVPGATVVVKGERKGTKTDSDGTFILSGINANSIIQVSSIGFQTKEILVEGKSLVIKMNEVINILDETIIKAGYYNTTQRYNTGNISIVKSEDIIKQPVSDPLLALQGRVPGMTIDQTRGVNGSQIKVQLRGANSILNGTQPLFIVDGIPYSPSVSTFRSFGAMGNNISALNFINPGDIESIEVLKDADATSIYGSRGANGVILINTKRGKSGATKVDINVYKGWANVAKRRVLMNSDQYLTMRKEAFYNDSINNPLSGIRPTIQNAPDLFSWDKNRYTDWQKLMIGGTAHYLDVQASISGGTPTVQYLIGGNYHKETTVYPGNFSSKRGGTHFNISGISPDQRLKTILTANYSTSSNNFPGVDFGSNIYQPPNTPPIYSPNGTLNWENSTWENPYSQLITKIVEPRINNLLANIDVSYRLLPDMSVKANFGMNDLRTNTFMGYTISGFKPIDQPNARAIAIYSSSIIKSWIFEPQILYSHSVLNGQLNASAGATLLGNRNEQQYTIASGIKDDALIRFMGAATAFTGSSEGTKYKYASFFARIGYIFKECYVLNVTARKDGSSRFGDRRKFASFGSIGAAWIFSQVPLLKNKVPFMTYGKLRFSYGTTGNDQIGDYRYLDRYQFQDQPYQGVKGLELFDLFNPDFSWELTKKMELGLETNWLDGRLSFNGSYYRNRSSNQLLPYPLPSISGIQSITGNLPAVIQNSGLELVLSTSNIQTKSFRWTTSFNISFADNKYISYSGNGVPFATIGKSLGVKDVYRYRGVDANIGTFLFSNVEGKPAPASEAQFNASFVNIFPKYFGGMQNTVSYKGIQIDLFFQYVKKTAYGGIFDTDPNNFPGKMRNQPVEALSRWRGKGDNSKYQRYSQNFDLHSSFSAWTNSDDAYVDASFIRLKNVSISWQLPENIRRKLKVDNCRIYFQGQNVFTITKYPGWDPETISALATPPLRVMTTGVQLTL